MSATGTVTVGDAPGGVVDVQKRNFLSAATVRWPSFFLYDTTARVDAMSALAELEVTCFDVRFAGIRGLVIGQLHFTFSILFLT